MAIGKLIGDYVGEGEAVAAGDTLDQEIGVAVEVRGGRERTRYIPAASIPWPVYTEAS